MNSNLELMPIYVGMIGLGGAFIGFLGSIITTLISRRSDERKQLQEIIVKSAIEDWKQDFELAKESKTEQYISPIDDYIIHMVKLSELLQRRKIKQRHIDKKLKELDNLSNLLARFRSEQISRNKRLGINLEKHNSPK